MNFFKSNAQKLTNLEIRLARSMNLKKTSNRNAINAKSQANYHFARGNRERYEHFARQAANYRKNAQRNAANVAKLQANKNALLRRMRK
jgi:hypothetical protein